MRPAVLLPLARSLSSIACIAAAKSLFAPAQRDGIDAGLAAERRDGEAGIVGEGRPARRLWRQPSP